MNLTVYGANALVNHMFRGIEFTMPTSLVMTLYTDDSVLDAEGGGTEVASGIGYAAQTITCNTGNWEAPVAGVSSNALELVFGIVTASWGSIRYIVASDEDDNRLLWSQLDDDETPGIGDTFRFPIGALDISFV